MHTVIYLPTSAQRTSMVTSCHSQAASENRERGDAEVAALLEPNRGWAMGFQETHAKALETASHREQTGMLSPGLVMLFPGRGFQKALEHRITKCSQMPSHKHDSCGS